MTTGLPDAVRAAPAAPTRRAVAALAAATATNLPYGTIYAFSVFLGPIEATLQVGRAQMSFVFALATIMLTVGMNVGPWLFGRLSPPAIALLAGLLGAAGLGLAATADGVLQLAVGYGAMFGLAGGLGYVLVLQGLNQSIRSSHGLANGYLVGLYPIGAMIGAPVFGWSIDAWGLRATLAGLGVFVLATAIVTGALLRLADVRLHDASAASADAPGGRQRRAFALLFAVFFLAASAGLMVMSQAAGILRAYGSGTLLAIGGTTAITAAIAAARIGGGWLVDRFTMPRVATAAHLWSLAGAVALVAWPGPYVALPALAMIGMGYGFVSGSTAGAIVQYWGRNASGTVAGRLYFAWCIAAVVLPVLAGWLFDRTQGYGTAIAIAAGVNVLGALAATRLPAPPRERLG